LLPDQLHLDRIPSLDHPYIAHDSETRLLEQEFLAIELDLSFLIILDEVDFEAGDF